MRVDIDGDAGHVGSRTVLSHGVPGDADGHLSVPRGGNQHEAHWRIWSGEKYEVTLTSVVDPATESDGLSLLPSGDRLVAVNLTVANAGTGIQQESIDDDVTLIDSGGHTYNGTDGIIYSVSQCQTFSGSSTPSARPERDWMRCVPGPEQRCPEQVPVHPGCRLRGLSGGVEPRLIFSPTVLGGRRSSRHSSDA